MLSLLQLPLPCVENSRYLTFEHFNALMSAIGFVEIRERWKKNGKMAYWLYRKATKGNQALIMKDFQKKVVRQGHRNNFCIVL
jgi:25S rRNA (adenine2142-N1)-methyltransferase